ncbi:MAG TPA: hypothetical protein VJW76_06765 [Verrucomicrobiae bacterium]|nr:hypothetical protein [Verrucomicrobiae bacterium]
MNRRNQSNGSQRFVAGLLIVCLTIASTGCESVRDSSITGRFWDFGGVNRCLPAPQSNVRLYRTSDSHEVLVTYDELREKDDSIRRRAFFFRPNLRRLEGGKKPKFVDPASIEELKLVQVLEATDTSTPGDAEIVATVSDDGQAFTLHWAGTQLGPYDLPVYADPGNGVRRFFLTPLIVAGDVIVVVVVVVVVAGIAVAYLYVTNCD